MQATGSSEDLRGALASPSRSLFSGGGNSPQTPRSSISVGASPSFSLRSSLGSPNISFANYLRMRNGEAPVFDEQGAREERRMEGVREELVSDPLATSINFSAIPPVLREEGDNQDGIVPAGDVLPALPPTEPMGIDKDEESTVRAEELSQSPGFSRAAKAKDSEDEDEEESERHGSLVDEDEDEDDYSEEELESEASQSDDDVSEEDTKAREEPRKKLKFGGSNEKIRNFMDQNSETLRTYLMELRDVKQLTFAQIAKEIEVRSKQKFSSESIARQIINTFLDENDNPSDSLVFSNYLRDHHEALVHRIKSWVRAAQRESKQISTRKIAERIVEEGDLEIQIKPVHMKRIWLFLKSNSIVINSEETILDVLKAHKEKTLRSLFQDFDGEFQRNLSLGTYKKGKYVPLLIKKLEDFASDHKGAPLKFTSDDAARAHVMTYLHRFDLELPGKRTRTPMTDFLKNPVNRDFIRDEILKLGPLWEDFTKRNKLVRNFEKVVSDHAGHECKFTRYNVGQNRLTVLLKRYTVKEDDSYKLKNLSGKREKKRRH
ncbi:MAG TPA: hypothetical protein PLY23_08195 [Alphaproteobacteria bacterium]|nr:hypothetical protein [Alphaproteobacteria bacterium]HQS94636.1 hypothetical protein [Alphaproteobacteria bacterium]